MRPILASLIAATALCSWGQTTTQRINKTTTISVSTTLPSGQAFGVKGIAADVSGTGEPFATIRTYLLPDTIKPAVVSVTAEDGAFEQQLKKPGQYRLTIHSVGRSPLSRDFDITTAAPIAALDTLYFPESDRTLGEVVVEAQKPLVSREIDRIAYDVTNDPDSKTNQLDEILKRVPMVSVDPDGTIKVKGSSSFLIYKNGRRNNAFSNNAKDIFKAIPASMIKKIEVITDPGAREDAEGVGTILNIVTVENTVIKGVMGTAGLNYSTTNNFPNPNLWLMSQLDKVTFSVYGSLYTKPSRSGKEYHSTERTFDDTDNTSRESTTQSVSRTAGNMGFELSYEIDTLNLITANFFASIFNSDTRARFDYGMFAPDGDMLYGYSSDRHTSPNRYHWLGGGFNYQRLTRRKGEKIILSYMISGNGSKSHMDNIYTSHVNLPVAYEGIIQTVNATFLEHTLQVDWTRPLWEGHTLDIGGKYIYRDNHSKSNQEYIGQNTIRNDFSHITQVGAAFVDYRVNINRWGLRAGVRYEFSRLAAKFHDGTNDDFHSTLNDWVPNAGISYNINDRNSMRLTYSSGIQRPGISYLNPTVITSPESTSQGNPDLSSVRNQNINLNYSFFSSKVNIDLNLSYGFSNNAIIQYQTAENDHLFSTYANAGKNRSFNSNIYIQWRAGKKTSVMLNGSANYNHYRNPSIDIRAGGWSGYAYMRIGQQLPWKLNLSLWGNYWGGWRSLYSVMTQVGTSCINYGLDLQRSFLKDNRLNVRVGVNNPFGNHYSRSKSHAINVPYTSHSYSRVDNPATFTVGISYRFGKLNAQVKKINVSKNNDLIGGPSR